MIGDRNVSEGRSTQQFLHTNYKILCVDCQNPVDKDLSVH